MHWKFLPNNPGYGDWLFPFIGDSSHTIDVVSPEKKISDRGTAKASRSTVTQWLKMLRQVHEAWKGTEPTTGYITLFPQRSALLGILNRIARRENRVIAWDFNLGSTPAGIRKRLARFALRDIERFVVNSSYERELYSEWLGMPIEKFYFCHYQKPEIDLQPVGANPKPRIVAVGSACRDYKTLCDAAQILKIPTVIVTAPYQATKISESEFVSIRSNVSRDDVHQLIQSASVHVLPLESEDTCTGHVTVVEGMWLKTLMVVSQARGLSDYVHDKETALTFRCGDAVELAGAVRSVIEDHDLSQRLVRNAFSFARENYTDERAGQHLRTLMDGCDRSEVKPGNEVGRK